MFGRGKRERQLTDVALAAQAEWAALTDADKRPLVEALSARRTPERSPARRVLPMRAQRGQAVAPTAEAAADTMIVSSVEAWMIYKRTGAFVCEPGRSLRPVRFIAFCVDGTLQREVPRVIAVRDRVPFDAAEQRRLMSSGTELDLRLADVIATVRRMGLRDTSQQVFLLTAPLQTGHVTLPAEVAQRALRRGPFAALAARAPRHRFGSERLRLGRVH